MVGGALRFVCRCAYAECDSGDLYFGEHAGQRDHPICGDPFGAGVVQCRPHDLRLPRGCEYFAPVAYLVSGAGILMGGVRTKPWNTYAGAFLGVAEAKPLIYGTNLGAILLRAFLASGLRGSSIRIVRMEDLFCVFGGALMMGLLFAEKAGIPLARALGEKMDGGAPIQLVMVFLLSNLIPAIVLTPMLPLCDGVLKKFWPSDSEDKLERPNYLTNQALADAETALDLIPNPLGRLFASVSSARATMGGGHDEGEATAFVILGGAIEIFCTGSPSKIH